MPWRESVAQSIFKKRGAVMKLQQVSESCFAVLNAKGRLCDSNSGFINRGGGVVVDTQSDLAHARRMAALFGGIGPGVPKRVINTNESSDHVWGNQVFAGAEIIAQRAVPGRMAQASRPSEYQALVGNDGGLLARLMHQATHPDTRAVGRQLQQDYDFNGIEPTLPATLFDERLVLDLDGVEVCLIHVGPCHRIGDTIVHVPAEGVVFAGDVVFRLCTPLGWEGTSERWLQALDLLLWLDPEVIVPGHGPLCGIEGAMEAKAYLEYVCDESRRCFGQGLDALEAAKRIDLGPYREWRCPARLYANVASAYREFRNEAVQAPLDAAGTFAAIYEVARARGIEVEF
jgi:cyclase